MRDDHAAAGDTDDGIVTRAVMYLYEQMQRQSSECQYTFRSAAGGGAHSWQKLACNRAMSPCNANISSCLPLCRCSLRNSLQTLTALLF